MLKIIYGPLTFHDVVFTHYLSEKEITNTIMVTMITKDIHYAVFHRGLNLKKTNIHDQEIMLPL